MSVQLFISDLHLCATRPETTAAFERFVNGPARQAETLWILGDLFEYWAGDDDLGSPFNKHIAGLVAGLANANVDVRIIVGNRDFLLGPEFAAQTGAKLEGEPFLLGSSYMPTLLMHGDALCTDDGAYQQFRLIVRNPAWQSQFLAQPLPVRHKIAEQLRAQSEMTKANKNAQIMDVNTDAVVELMQTHSASRLIHGHTHRPATHTLNIDDHRLERWVLADWHDTAQWLHLEDDTLSAHSETR